MMLCFGGRYLFQQVINKEKLKNRISQEWGSIPKSERNVWVKLKRLAVVITANSNCTKY